MSQDRTGMGSDGTPSVSDRSQWEVRAVGAPSTGSLRLVPMQEE